MSKDSFFEANSITFWQDTEALREFKNGLDPNSVRPGSCLSSWDFTLDPCDNLFTCGFRCDLVISTMSRVTELALDQAGYVGSLASTSWILLHLLLLLLHTQLARPEPNHRLRTPKSSSADKASSSSLRFFTSPACSSTWELSPSTLFRSSITVLLRAPSTGFPSDSVLPSHLETRFRRLKSLPTTTTKSMSPLGTSSLWLSMMEEAYWSSMLEQHSEAKSSSSLGPSPSPRRRQQFCC
ncbi:uncharacterized protein LOC114282393 [Camellia sinensis]|uniref:uncharacterized protein LOC114282393 n=1 Tax=Camellia sinensis TaxID=4442 RepID=UPI0010359F75|nr:uncharacterized protein LOC114282393 [Camellia sinensis]